MAERSPARRHLGGENVERLTDNDELLSERTWQREATEDSSRSRPASTEI